MAKLINSFSTCTFMLIFSFAYVQSSHASDGGIRVDRQRCSTAVQEAQYDLAFMKRIAAAAQTYEPVLLRYVNERYLPLDIRFRNEPYKNESRRLQYEKALEVTRSANFLEINCRKVLAGGNGRAYDKIGSGFETDNQKKYFKESIQIDNEELGPEYETSDHIRGVYLRRMGTVQHEIFHNWSYDHKRHGSDLYRRSMNQVARHALQDSFNSKWIRPENSNPAACQTLRNCRRDGYLVMRNLRNEDYLAFDPLRRGIGLLSFKNPGNPLDRLVVVDNAILGNELLHPRDGLTANPSYPNPLPRYRPASGDKIVATSKPGQSGRSSNKILLQNSSGLKYLKWGGVANKPNFSIELEIPYRTPIVQTDRRQPRVNFSETTEVIGFNSSGTTDFYIKNGTQEISSFRPSTNQVLARFRLRTGDRLAHTNSRFPSVFVDGRVEFLADGKFTPDGRQQILVGTQTQLILLQMMAAGLRVVAAQTRPEFWSGTNRWDRDSQARHPVQVGDFNADGTMDILLTNDSGLRILSVDRRNNRFNEIGRLDYGTDISGRAFSESQNVMFFGKYATFNNRDAILIHDDDHMRVVYLTGRDGAGVFAEILGPSRRGPLGRPPILGNDQVSIGSPRHSRPSWRYDPNRDKPVLVRDFTGNGFNEVVLERRSRSDQKLQRLGILRLGASVPRGLHLKDFNVADCYGHEACHGGHFGHWLLRNTDSVSGTVWDNANGRAMLMIMNNPE